ncbi:unnamed protein product, partial [Rotaria sp. Silwood2]
MNEKCDLSAFKPQSIARSTWPLSRWNSREVPSLLHQFLEFNFANHIQHKPTATARPSYTADCCAYPNCDNKQVMKSNMTHLQLCENHNNELDSKLRNIWIPSAAMKNYNAIKAQGESDSDASHNEVYYQLLPQLDKWIEQIDDIIPTYYTGTDATASAVNAWLILQLRPMRQLLMLMKLAIFVYRMHLNQNPM